MNDIIKLIKNSVSLIYDILAKTFKPNFQNFANHNYGTTTIAAGATANVFTHTPGGMQEVFNFKWRLDDSATGTGVFFDILINNNVMQEWGIIEAVNNDLFNSEVSFVIDSSKGLTLRCQNTTGVAVKVNYHYWSWINKSIREELNI